MIAFLQGTILAHTKSGAIIKSGDVGYDCIGGWLLSEPVGSVESLYCYHYLENQTIPRLLALRTLSARDLVISLLDVSGVGPKMAGRILDTLPPERLVTAITGGDLTTLSSVKGLGKKTAQKIILELGKTLVTDAAPSTPYNDALLSLGFTQTEISQAISSTDLEGLTESQALSALMRALGKNL